MDKKRRKWTSEYNPKMWNYRLRKRIMEEVFEDGKVRYAVEILYPHSTQAFLDVVHDHSTNADRLAIFDTLEEAKEYVINSIMPVKRVNVAEYAYIK